MNKYVKINQSSSFAGAISLKAISKIASCALEDLPYVSLNSELKADKTNLVSVRVNSPLLTRLEKDGKVSIYFHVSIREGENAAGLCSKMQEEVMDQVSAMLEISRINVNIKVDGIM